MLATKLLKSQHREVEALFTRIAGKEGNKRALVQKLCDNLAAHMVIEEQFFYPAAKRLKPDLVLEAYEEHDVARYAMRSLLATSVDDERFEARRVTLMELIEHHVEEEEEELFPKVEKAMDREKLDVLGLQMKQAFDEFVTHGFQQLFAAGEAQPQEKTAARKAPSPKTTQMKSAKGISAKTATSKSTKSAKSRSATKRPTNHSAHA